MLVNLDSCTFGVIVLGVTKCITAPILCARLDHTDRLHVKLRVVSTALIPNNSYGSCSLCTKQKKSMRDLHGLISPIRNAPFHFSVGKRLTTVHPTEGDPDYWSSVGPVSSRHKGLTGHSCHVPQKPKQTNRPLE